MADTLKNAQSIWKRTYFRYLETMKDFTTRKNINN
ncbi:Protein of unknown function [Bacillus cereus]|nr:Protein of unknown function [Bacillus cereus]